MSFPAISLIANFFKYHHDFSLLEGEEADSKNLTSEPTVEVFLPLEDLNEEIDDDPLADEPVIKKEAEEEEDAVTVELEEEKTAAVLEGELEEEATALLEEELEEEATDLPEEEFDEEATTEVEEDLEEEATATAEEDMEEDIEDDEDLIDPSTLLEQQAFCDSMSG
jgi:fused signal recognition particle receptor